jgi:hypothetical protein
MSSFASDSWCRAVVSLMRKWTGDEEGDDLATAILNTLQWAADLAVQMIDGALNDLDCSGEKAPGRRSNPPGGRPPNARGHAQGKEAGRYFCNATSHTASGGP